MNHLILLIHAKLLIKLNKIKIIAENLTEIINFVKFNKINK